MYLTLESLHTTVWSRGQRRYTSFSEFNQPHDRYERAPTRGRPSAGPRPGFLAGKRVASIDSLNSLNKAAGAQAEAHACTLQLPATGWRPQRMQNQHLGRHR